MRHPLRCGLFALVHAACGLEARPALTVTGAQKPPEPPPPSEATLEAEVSRAASALWDEGGLAAGSVAEQTRLTGALERLARRVADRGGAERARLLHILRRRVAMRRRGAVRGDAETAGLRGLLPEPGRSPSEPQKPTVARAAVRRAWFDGGGWLVLEGPQGRLTFWNPITGRPSPVRLAYAGGEPTLPVHPTGRWLLRLDAEHRVHLMDATDGTSHLTLTVLPGGPCLVTTPDGFVDGAAADVASVRRVPGLFARTLGNHRSHRLGALLRLLWPETGVPPLAPLTSADFRPEGRAPSWTTIYALGEEPGWRNVRAWFHRTSLGGRRWVAVVEGNVGVGFEVGFKLLVVERQDGAWIRRASLRLPLSAPGEQVPFAGEKRRSGAWTSAGDFDADGRPEVRVRYTYPVHPTRKIGPTLIIDEAVVNVDGTRAQLAFHGQVHETVPRSDGEPLKAYGKLAFVDRDEDGHPDIVLTRTRPVEVWKHGRAWTRWQRARRVYRYRASSDRWLVDAYAP